MHITLVECIQFCCRGRHRLTARLAVANPYFARPEPGLNQTNVGYLLFRLNFAPYSPCRWPSPCSPQIKPPNSLTFPRRSPTRHYFTSAFIFPDHKSYFRCIQKNNKNTCRLLCMEIFILVVCMKTH